MPENPSPLDAVKLTLSDGVPRELRYTLGTVRRLRKTFGGEISELLQKPSDEVLPVLIYEGLIDKTGVDADAIADLIDVSSVQAVVVAFLEAFTGQRADAIKNEPAAVEAVTLQ